MDTSLTNLQRELATNQQQEIRLSTISKEIAREIEKIVMGLQFQDIVSQKVQHVKGVLPQIAARFQEFTAARDFAAASEPMQYLQLTCQLEAAQLRSAQTELAEAGQTIQQGVQSLIAHLSLMDAKCLSLEEFKLLTTSFNGMVQELLEIIEEVHELTDSTVQSATKAYEMLQPWGGLASNLTGIVRGMCARNHIIGLNAQVKAAQVAQDGRGAGLEVLSSQICEICNETNRISELTAVKLDALATGLLQSVEAFSALRNQGLAQQAVLQEQGRAEEKELHAFRDAALQTLDALGNSLEAIDAQARRTLDAAQFTSFHEITLPALSNPLAGLGTAAEKWLRDFDCAALNASVISDLRKEYTMASERAVFDQITGTAKESAPSADAVAPVESAMEWFDAAPLPTAETSGWADAPAQVDALALAPAGKSEPLGANVELF